MKKYLKLRSLTWWASFTPIALGVFVATEPLHGMTTAIEVIGNMTDHASPYFLINAGLAGIGIRGALT